MKPEQVPETLIEAALATADDHYVARQTTDGRAFCACGSEIPDPESEPWWDRHLTEAALNAVLPAHEAMVREQVALQIEAVFVMAHRGQSPADAKAEAYKTAAQLARGARCHPDQPKTGPAL